MKPVHAVIRRLSALIVPLSDVSWGSSATQPAVSARGQVARNTSAAASHVSVTVASSRSPLASRIRTSRSQKDPSEPVA